jgi:hypothetical protein
VYNHVIRWSDDGTCIVVHKSRQFMDILKLYVNTTKYSSFRRQLNYYGFTKTASSGAQHHFYHPNFCSTGFVKNNRKRESEDCKPALSVTPLKRHKEEDAFAAVDFKLLDDTFETMAMSIKWEDIYRLEQKCTQ